MANHLEVAERLFAAITRADIAGVRDVYAPNCVIWHNHDSAEQNVETNLKVLGWVTKNVKDLRYEEIRRQETPTGFVQQHVLRGIAPSGTAVAIPACIVCRVENGRITRLDEYIDSAQIMALLG